MENRFEVLTNNTNFIPVIPPKLSELDKNFLLVNATLYILVADLSRWIMDRPNKISELEESMKLLTDLLDAVIAEESMLSGGTKYGIGAEAIQSLRETKISFGNPKANLTRLTTKLFKEVGIELTSILKKQLRNQFDFYYIIISASLQPKPGAQFSRIECFLEFRNEKTNEPIVLSIFPRSEWKEVIKWGGGLQLGLDSNLQFATNFSQPAPNNSEELVPDVFNSRINAGINKSSQLKVVTNVPDFVYELGRSEVVATGEGSSQCFWRIDDPDLQKIHTVEFGVVFKVPKGTEKIELFGLMIAESKMSWLVANLRDVIEDLGDKYQKLLVDKDQKGKHKHRLPVGDSESWEILLPK